MSQVLTGGVDLPILSLEETLRRLPVTLIVGWICDDGILLAADDETIWREAGRFPQKQRHSEKLLRVGKDCAVGLTGNATAAWADVRHVADSYSISQEVDAIEVVAALTEQANQKHKEEQDLSFVVAGFTKTADGKRKSIYLVQKTHGEYQLWESGRFLFVGVRYLCQFLENYVPTGRIRTLQQAKRVASILISLTHTDVVGGVGVLGSVAEVTESGCTIIVAEDMLRPLHQVGADFQRDLRKILEQYTLEIAELNDKGEG